MRFLVFTVRGFEVFYGFLNLRRIRVDGIIVEYTLVALQNFQGEPAKRQTTGQHLRMIFQGVGNGQERLFNIFSIRDKSGRMLPSLDGKRNRRFHKMFKPFFFRRNRRNHGAAENRRDLVDINAKALLRGFISHV